MLTLLFTNPGNQKLSFAMHLGQHGMEDTI